MGLLLRGSGAAAALGSQVLLARAMGVAGFGVYATVVAWITVLSLAAGAGMPMASLRFVPGYLASMQWANAAGFVRHSLRVTLGGSAMLSVAFVVLHLVVPTLRPTLAAGMTGAVLLPVMALLGLAGAQLQALQRPLASELSANLFRSVLLALSVGLVLACGFRLSPVSALALTIGAGLVSLALVGGMARRALVAAMQPATPSLAGRRAWRGAATAFVMALGAAAMLERLDVMVVGLLLDPAAAGAYGAASRLAAPIGLALTSVGAMLGPLSVQRLAERDLISLQALSTRGALLAVGLAAIPSLMLIVASSQFLALFGAGFADAAPALEVLAFGYLAAAALGAPTGLLMLAGHNRVALSIIGGSVLVSAALSLMLVPLLGSVGAAIGTAVALLAQGTVGAIAAHRLLGIDTTVAGALIRRRAMVHG